LVLNELRELASLGTADDVARRLIFADRLEASAHEPK
jgi:hypothetical protein